MAFGNKSGKGPISEINVTPLVDVMLVLLVIFMISAPLMFNGVKLTLPKTKKVHSLSLNSEQVILSLTLSDELFIGKEKVLKSELINELQTAFSKTKRKVLYLRADDEVKYGKVAKLVSYLKKSGVTQIALVTQIENNK